MHRIEFAKYGVDLGELRSFFFFFSWRLAPSRFVILSEYTLNAWSGLFGASRGHCSFVIAFRGFNKNVVRVDLKMVIGSIGLIEVELVVLKCHLIQRS